MKAIIDVQSERGYVWDADAALWLRETCGIVGSMIGGVAGFKQQNALHGLPMELEPEEITLALVKGWADLRTCSPQFEEAASLKRRRSEVSDGNESLSDSQSDSESSPAYKNAPQPAWKKALARNTHLVIPTVPPFERPAGQEDGEAAPTSKSVPEPSIAPASAAYPVDWTYPRTPAQRARLAVFVDLHARGYRLTGGSKFGADFLLYPGDPTLFHAQFCLRLVPLDAPLDAVLLTAACRGSHQARKHLLLASYVEVEEGEREDGHGSLPAGKVQYLTIGPVEGFG